MVVVEVVVVVVVVCPPLHNPVRVSHFGFPRLPSPESGLSLSGHLLASERPTTSKVARRDPAPGLIVFVFVFVFAFAFVFVLVLQNVKKRSCTWPHSICACAAVAVK